MYSVVLYTILSIHYFIYVFLYLCKWQLLLIGRVHICSLDFLLTEFHSCVLLPSSSSWVSREADTLPTLLPLDRKCSDCDRKYSDCPKSISASHCPGHSDWLRTQSELVRLEASGKETSLLFPTGSNKEYEQSNKKHQRWNLPRMNLCKGTDWKLERNKQNPELSFHTSLEVTLSWIFQTHKSINVFILKISFCHFQSKVLTDIIYIVLYISDVLHWK